MKKIAALIAILPLIAAMGLAHAQSLGGQKTFLPDAELQNPSIAPDHPLYGLSRAFDRLSMLLTFGPEAKAEKALEQANRRLADVKVMIEKKRDDLAQKAAQEHDESIKEAEQYIDSINGDNSAKELEIKSRIELKVKNNKEKIQMLKTRFVEKEKILEKLENRTGRLEEKISQEKEKLREKIEARAQAAIDDAKNAIDDAKQNVAANTTAARLLSNAQEKLESAQKAFEDKNYGMAFGQATAAKSIAKNILRPR